MTLIDQVLQQSITSLGLLITTLQDNGNYSYVYDKEHPALLQIEGNLFITALGNIIFQ